MGWPTGFAPATTSATDWCSAVELRPPYFYYTIIAGAPGRIRTPNTRSEAWRDIHFTTRALRSTQGKLFLLDQVYTELIFDERSGAGERNRTVALTLEGSRSTIKLHPHFGVPRLELGTFPTLRRDALPPQSGTADSNRESLGPKPSALPLGQSPLS